MAEPNAAIPRGLQTKLLKLLVILAITWSLLAPLAGAALYPRTGNASAKTPHGVAKIVFFCHLG